MSRYVWVQDNIVINIIVWDGVTPYTPPPGILLAKSDDAQIGWRYNPETGEFTPPSPPPEEEAVVNDNQFEEETVIDENPLEENTVINEKQPEESMNP